MPIKDIKDAVEVENHIQAIFAAAPSDRSAAVRRLFVETLDFDADFGQASLAGALSGKVNASLPGAADRIAQMSGVHVLYIALEIAETDRVRAAEAVAATKLIADQLGDDLVLVFTNTSATQLHFIHPNLEGARPVLRRMVVERDLPRRTAVQQVANIYWDHRRSRDIRAALESAFDVEKVTTRFFDEYERIFGIFEAAESGVVGFGDDEKDQKRLFVQTLFNRLMFVYFLQRKGWLTFNGDNDYLNALWNDYAATDYQGNFYVDRLKVLFFSGLNNPQSINLVRDNPVVFAAIGSPPFLNGGLFERTDLDKRDGIHVPDDAIERILSDLFDKFNFTVMESTPLDIEVAVDPEMLGKVFEELVTDRHGSGAYYTPRPVVSFMCREALKGYLAGQDTGLDDGAIARFVDQYEPSGISLASASKVGHALDEVTVVDPACGSGAYLLGMMQELIELQTALYNVGVDARSLYELKLHIIERNLHGVDNDEFAVNIAMLRLWLSLAIDYEGDSPPPLPNLDFKIVCGDSLLGPDPSQLSLERGLIERSRIGEYKADYMRESNASAKAAFKKRIAEAESELRDSIGGTTVPDGVVDWRIAFAEVLGEHGAFHVVLANPPYVVTSGTQLRAMYKEGVFGRMNTYGLFIQRSLQLMKAGSQLVFINPRTLLTDRYFINLRKIIKRTAELRGVVLIQDRHHTFAKVLQECIILYLAKQNTPTSNYPVRIRSVWRPDDLNDLQSYHSVASQRVMLDENYDHTFYVGTSEFEYLVFERMNEIGKPLSHFGLKAETGKIQFDKYRQYVQKVKSIGSCRLIWAENVQRYWMQQSKKRIGREWLEHGIISEVSPSISNRGIVTQRTSANEQPRRIIATLITRSADESVNVFSENGTNFISLDNSVVRQTFMIGVLNSCLIEFIFRRLNSNVHVSAGELNKLPLPHNPDDTTLREIEKLVFALMKLGGVGCQAMARAQAIAYEQRIDQLVGTLYGLSATDVEEIQRQLPSYGAVYGLTDDEYTTVERRLGLIHQTADEEDEALARAMDEALAEDPDGLASQDVAMTTLRGLNEG